MNTGEGSRQNWLILLAVAGVLISAFHLRRFAALLLLWIPLPFYAYSIAYGSVPIFVPEWWPFSYYNVRYGLELLPAIAVFAALIPWAIARLHRALAHRWLLPRLSSLITLLAFNSSAGCFSTRSQDRELGTQVDDSHLLSRSLGQQPRPPAAGGAGRRKPLRPSRRIRPF